MKRNLSVDRILRTCVVLLVLALLMRAGFRAAHNSKMAPNQCPIDGHVAEWTKPRNATTCDYGHFSNNDRTPHAWFGACL
jgi:hypothetical protein